MNIARTLAALFKAALRPSQTVVRDRHSGLPVPARETPTASEGQEVGPGQLVPLDLPLPGRFYLWRPPGGGEGTRPETEEGLYLIWAMHTPRLGELQVAAFATSHEFQATFFTASEATAGALRAALPALRPRLTELGYGRVWLSVRDRAPVEDAEPTEAYDWYV